MPNLKREGKTASTAFFNKYWWAVAAICLCPILCNILVCTYCSCFVVACNASDWLQFFGNYFGSVITAVVSFVVLWYTRKDYFGQMKLETQLQEEQMAHAEIVDEIHDLSDRLAQNVITPLFNLKTLSSSDVKEYKNLLPMLQEKHAKIKGLQYSARIMYGCDNAGCQSFLFLQKYLSHTEDILRVISSFIKLITNEERSNDKVKFASSCMEDGKMVEMLEAQQEEVFKAAQEYIKFRLQEFFDHQKYRKEALDNHFR